MENFIYNDYIISKNKDDTLHSWLRIKMNNRYHKNDKPPQYKRFSEYDMIIILIL